MKSIQTRYRNTATTQDLERIYRQYSNSHRLPLNHPQRVKAGPLTMSSVLMISLAMFAAVIVAVEFFLS